MRIGKSVISGELKMRKISLQLLLAGVSAMATSAAFAQDAPAALPSNAGPTSGASTAPSDAIAASQGAAPSAVAQPDNNGVQDIVVTAQRRAQNLLSVPLSISASTGAQLQNQGIKEITSLQFTTPGFLPENGVGYVQVFIRGIGNNQFVGTGPSVTTYIDDVPRIFSSQVNSFADVERVEILKGAQGGLYGYNSTGGVINIITRQPSDKASADAIVSYGTRHTLDAKAYVNVPLSDHIAMNMAVTRESHAPYIRNTTRDRNPYTAAMFPTTTPYGTAAQTAALFNTGLNPPGGLGNQNFWAIESKLRIQAADNIKITFAGDYAKKHDSEGDQWTLASSPAALQGYVTNVFYPFVAGINPFGAVSGVPSAGTPTQPGGIGPNGGPCQNGYVCLPGGFIKNGRTGKWTTAASVPASANLVDYGGSAKIEFGLPGVDITSISSYRGQRTLYENDSGTDNIPFVVPVVRNRKWYWYQELRAVSNGSGPFHFIAGATYLREHVNYNTVIRYFNLFPGAVTDSNHNNHNWSVYAQVGYDFTDKLNLTVSGRYVSLKDAAVFDSPSVSRAAISNKKFLPSATLSYKANGGVIYARYAKGFKEGGINPVVPPSSFIDSNTGHVSPGFVFGPEEVDTYEVGARGKLFDNKLQYTLAAFYNKYKGLQAATTGDGAHPGIIEAIINAGTARTYGVEGSINWRPIRPLTLSVNAGWLNAKYIKYAQTDGSTGLATFNLSGQRMIYAPKLQAGFTADLDQPITDKLRLVGSVLVSHISKTIQAENPGQANVVQPGYWLSNMRIGVRTMDDHVGIYAFVNNVFNKYYTTFGSSSGLNAAQVEGDPRIIGGEVQIKF
jgi:iron complex outermembrane receptor protein